MSNGLNPIVIGWGDDMSQIAAREVWNRAFASKYPAIEIDLSVEARLWGQPAQDYCIRDFCDAMRQYRFGVKISTASQRCNNDSANLQIRPALDAICAVRITQAKGWYGGVVGGVRALTGCFYGELSGTPEILINGRRHKIYQQLTNLDAIAESAAIAVQVAKQNGQKLLLATKKSTGAPSETDFYSEVTTRLDRIGVTYEHVIADTANAQIGLVEEKYRTGNWLLLVNNQRGDEMLDVVNQRHGGKTMGSTVYCFSDSQEYVVYEEQAGGSDPDNLELWKKGSPTKHYFFYYALMFGRSIIRANPTNHETEKDCNRIMTEAVKLFENIPKDEQETAHMLDCFSKAIAS